MEFNKVSKRIVWTAVLAISCAVGAAGAISAAENEDPNTSLQSVPEELEWHKDYGAACHKASTDGKMLFIYFEPDPQTKAAQSFESQSITDKILQPFTDRYVWLRLPIDARQSSKGDSQKLLNHAAFSEMHGQPGIAILDLANRQAQYFGHVVSAFPFPTGTYYGPRHLTVILGLPQGTLTQRTLVYAVRVHPEVPASAWSQFSPQLANQAENHSNHQASINLQGHHNWESRFHMINATLPGGLIAQEVVAESWPGQDMLSAAHECVHSWRQSEGHWDAVRSRHGLFGFDLKRGSNGTWYGTGLFGKFRR